MDLLQLLVCLSLALAAHVHAAGPALGELDQIYFGVWVDPDLGFQDTPTLFNSRLQRNASVFHIAQRMPLLPYNYTTGVGGPAPEYLIENTATDAAVFLTVYPAALNTISDADYTILGTQLLAYTKDFNRTVFLRWAPEMQGRWNEYGQQPVAFVQAWQAMYKAVKAIAPETIVVWAPNLGHDYPYGQTANIDPTDMAVLDTNQNGRLDKGDDPYTPYYPGDDYVDWIGISVYFKQFSRNINAAQPAGFCADILTGIETQTRANTGFDWYNQFCASKPTKACLIAESGAAYHPDVPGGASELAIKQAWWQDCITNTTFLQAYPRIKLHMHFEFQKVEADIGPPDVRDYRLTNTTEILTAFQTDLNTVQNNYLWAQYRPITRPIQVNGPGVSAPATSSFSVPTLVLQTARNPHVSGLPTLFGVKRHSGVDKRRTALARALCVVAASSLVLVSGWLGHSRKNAIRRRRPVPQ
ncbi:hypothetical protein PTTG_29564 [Puccinia triticina 1-1 BBBD Race 1]|uniref:GH26 domain-containing protein n=1 Tax=Puccinia triticina (isolate 1-1 / race 1 (BBBD)) TaxID=630390 RepID=A0A180G5H8_PUCT1|nr:hypothetical protein PTTG_29564 [Puccinia triticina 1-1 BBBD Race 1]